MEYLYYGWIDKYMVFSICMCVIVVVKKNMVGVDNMYAEGEG